MHVDLLWLTAALLSFPVLTLCDPLNVLVAPNLLRVGTTEKVFVEAQDYNGGNIQVKISVKNHPKKTSELTSQSVVLTADKNFQAIVDIMIKAEDGNALQEYSLFLRGCGKVMEEVQYMYASKDGYGTVTYLLTRNMHSLVHCAFIMGKSRVAPMKSVTIPRMELIAATMASRMDVIWKKELHLQLQDSVFWTDGASVLKYIKNETSRFKIFVANRVTEILKASQASQWRYVDTASCPADVASRGSTAKVFLKNRTWISGPAYQDANRWLTYHQTESLRMNHHLPVLGWIILDLSRRHTVVLIVDNTAPRNSWLIGRIIQTFPDRRGFVHHEQVKTKTNCLERPITKVCLLQEAEDG
ncbi:uncharacterized protein LOC120720149 [Tachysurus ichikawai]